MTKNYSRIEAENRVQDYMQVVGNNVPVGAAANSATSGPTNPKQYVVGEIDVAAVSSRVMMAQIVDEFGLFGAVEERIRRGANSESIIIYELGPRKLVGYTILDA